MELRGGAGKNVKKQEVNKQSRQVNIFQEENYTIGLSILRFRFYFRIILNFLWLALELAGWRWRRGWFGLLELYLNGK